MQRMKPVLPVAARLALLTFCLLGFSIPAHAQLASDVVPRERTLPESEQMRRDLEASRWHFGAFRVRPLLSLRDFGYDNNVAGTTDNPVGDWRATTGAGVRLTLPLGVKTYFQTTIDPEYTWYQKLTNRRAFGGVYDANVLGLFNRLTLAGGVGSVRRIEPVSSEAEQSALGRLTDLYGRGELQIFRRLSLFGSAESQEHRYRTTGADFDTLLTSLERTETFYRGGVRYRFRSYLDFSAAAESGTTDFRSAIGRDNTTKAVLLGVHYDLPRTFINISVGSRTGEPRNSASVFPRYSTTTGSYYGSYQLTAPLSVDVFGRRRVAYSLTTENPYYFETRNGLGVTVPVGQRLALRGMTEIGRNAYPLRVNGVKRTDDVTTLGAGVQYRLYRKTSLLVLATNSKYNSNIDNADRSVFRVTTTLAFGGDTFR